MSINYQQLITSIIERDFWRMSILEEVSLLGLDDWCLGAGFVRNCVWDHMHGYTSSTPLNDIDVCYYNCSDVSREKDIAYEVMLQSKHADVCWSVKNQARMHIPNKCSEYKSTLDAMKYWPELQTAVGVSLGNDGKLVIKSVFALSVLFDTEIKMNPEFGDSQLFISRVKNKKWLEIWPKLSVNFA